MKRAVLFFFLLLPFFLASMSSGRPDLTISGTITYKGAGLAGVVLEGLPGPPITDASGHYSAACSGAYFVGNAIPTLAGYSFTPPYTAYTEVTGDQVTDYEAVDAGFRLDTYTIPAELEQRGMLCNAIPIDFNHDGFMDIVATQYCPSPNESYSVPAVAYENDGTGHFTEVTARVLGDFRTYGGCGWFVADFDGDGLDDLFLSDGGIDQPPYAGARHFLLMGRADGMLVDEGSARVPAPREIPSNGDAGDVDNDGDVDILTCGSGGTDVMLINDGTGHFTYDAVRMPPHGVEPPDFLSTNGQLIDTDNDGDLDVFFGTNQNFGERDVLLVNDGTGRFERAPDSALPPRYGGEGWNTGCSVSGDLNGDGWRDILLVMDNMSGPTYQVHLQLLLNNGDGTFQDATSRLWENGASGISGNRRRIGDLNGDGWPDLLTYKGIAGTASRLHINHGGDSFEDITERVFPARPVTLEHADVAADVDNDGDADIIGVYPALKQVFVLVNEKPYAVPEAPLSLPATPIPLMPANGMTLTTVEASLGWTSVTAAPGYRLQVASDISFSQKICDRPDLTTNSFRLRGLAGNATYYWRVCAVNARPESVDGDLVFHDASCRLRIGQRHLSGSAVPGSPDDGPTGSAGDRRHRAL